MVGDLQTASERSPCERTVAERYVGKCWERLQVKRSRKIFRQTDWQTQEAETTAICRICTPGSQPPGPATLPKNAHARA